jgi:hypothetical protein
MSATGPVSGGRIDSASAPVREARQSIIGSSHTLQRDRAVGCGAGLPGAQTASGLGSARAVPKLCLTS